MNSKGELFKADGDDRAIDHCVKYHLSKEWKVRMRDVQWWNPFNRHLRWYCDDCKTWL